MDEATRTAVTDDVKGQLGAFGRDYLEGYQRGTVQQCLDERAEAAGESAEEQEEAEQLLMRPAPEAGKGASSGPVEPLKAGMVTKRGAKVRPGCPCVSSLPWAHERWAPCAGEELEDALFGGAPGPCCGILRQ